jgi:site-specific recombinase XerD
MGQGLQITLPKTTESQVIIKRIRYKGEEKIGLFFPFNPQLKEAAKQLGAQYSSTHRFWHLALNKANAEACLKAFPTAHVIKTNSTLPPDQQQKPEQPAISEGQATLPQAVTQERPEHKQEESLPAAQKDEIRYLETRGKYWVVKIPFQADRLKKLKQVKGVFWNANHASFYILRRPKIKVQVEAIIGKPGILPIEYLPKQEFEDRLVVKPHPESKKYVLVEFPRISHLEEVIRRMSGAYFSKAHRAYALPAHNTNRLLLEQMAQKLGLEWINEATETLWRGAESETAQSRQLREVLHRLNHDIPIQARPYALALKDMLLAKNYSGNTIRTYVGAFLHFLGSMGYPNPDEITRRQIISHLAKMAEKGLKSSSLHSLVNALKFYYSEVLLRSDFAIEIPRAKKEQPLVETLTLEECIALFGQLTNPKHKLLLLLAYGTGMRLSELVHLRWEHIRWAEHKILVKSGKGKKDRMVTLPSTLMDPLRYYRQLHPAAEKAYVFQGQRPGEPYSSRSVQSIMKRAVEGAGLQKRATVHTLRHAFATHLLYQGVDIRFIQKLLGHENIKTTMLYTRLVDKQLPEIASPLDNLMNQAKKLENNGKNADI